jgi:hypothetical protein
LLANTEAEGVTDFIHFCFLDECLFGLCLIPCLYIRAGEARISRAKVLLFFYLLASMRVFLTFLSSLFADSHSFLLILPRKTL